MSGGRHGPPEQAADSSRLPEGWRWDPMLAEEVYGRVRTLSAQGETARDIALRLGCAQRTVVRIRNRVVRLNRCGAPRTHHTYVGKPCGQLVPRAGEHCRYHR